MSLASRDLTDDHILQQRIHFDAIVMMGRQSLDTDQPVNVKMLYDMLLDPTPYLGLMAKTRPDVVLRAMNESTALLAALAIMELVKHPVGMPQ